MHGNMGQCAAGSKLWCETDVHLELTLAQTQQGIGLDCNGLLVRVSNRCLKVGWIE